MFHSLLHELTSCLLSFVAFLWQPSVKATFSITLVTPQGMTCLSNMSIKSTTLLPNGMQEVTFLKTPIMATYVSLFDVLCYKPFSVAAMFSPAIPL